MSLLRIMSTSKIAFVAKFRAKILKKCGICASLYSDFAYNVVKIREKQCVGFYEYGNCYMEETFWAFFVGIDDTMGKRKRVPPIRCNTYKSAFQR